MTKLFNLFRKVQRLPKKRKARGFAEFPLWANMLTFASFSAWVFWLGSPTGEAFRQFDRISAAHGIDGEGLVVLAFLLVVAASLLCATIIAGAAFKAIVDRLQNP